MKVDFEKRIVFLTGGSRGIGATIKKMFEQDGVAVIAPSREELDLSSRQSIRSYLRENSGLQPDIFIHCAGINELAGITEISQEILDRVFQVNYYAPVELLNHFCCAMRNKQWGRIVFISSLYALVSKERRIAYSSSKSALNGLTKTLALELAKDNILVNEVAPGYVMTDMTKKNLSVEEIEALENMIPTGRFQTEEDIAYLTGFLCSEQNRNITGQLIAVDGGFTCR